MEPIKIMMFCEGNAITFDGYECDFVICAELDKPVYKEQGYVDHPKELESNGDLTDEIEELELLEEKQDELEEDFEKKLRDEAKEKGVKSWHVKSIDTLKAELGYE